jgi:2-polyprenyl-3-methyl-5-hydroxy-6-metoxy-1,4-benzoquinol methylase
VTAPRYDEHAAWYVNYTANWELSSTSWLPPDLNGQHVLDLGCGWGQLSRELAENGSAVTAVDLSERLLDRARDIERLHPAAIRYLHGDARGLDWWDGTAYDGVVCNMALMDIDDLDAAMRTVASVLRPSGWFNLSLLHPCFPGDASTNTLPSWPPDRGYAAEGWWTTGSVGVRGRVGAHHRTLSTYLNAVLHAELEFEAFTEPAVDLPRVLIIQGRRPVR